MELGRIDICYEVSMQSLLPRKYHLEQAFHLIGYLKNKHSSQIIFNPNYPVIEYSDFHEDN